MIIVVVTIRDVGYDYFPPRLQGPWETSLRVLQKIHVKSFFTQSNGQNQTQLAGHSLGSYRP